MVQSFKFNREVDYPISNKAGFKEKIDFSVMLAQPLYYQKDMKSDFKIAPYFNPKYKKYFNLQTYITSALKQGTKLSRDFRLVSEPNKCNLAFDAYIENRNVTVREARYKLEDSSEMNYKINEYFESYTNCKILLYHNLFIMPVFSKPNYIVDNSSTVIGDINSGNYNGDFSKNLNINGFTFDTEYAIITKLAECKDKTEIPDLKVFSNIDSDVKSYLESIINSHDGKILFSNVIFLSEIKITAIPPQDKPYVTNTLNLFVGFDVLNGICRYEELNSMWLSTLAA